jgi:hypothetical protein
VLGQRPSEPAKTDASTTSTETPTATPTPSETATAEVVPADALVVVTATATDVSGAQLDLRMVVHQPVSKSDPSAAGQLAALTSACTPEHDWAAIAAEAGSGIETVDVTATQRGAIDWPATAEIELFPLSDGFHPKLPTGTGIDYTVAMHNEVPQPTHCFDIMSLFGEADGGFSLYMFPREYLGEPISAPNVYRWNSLEYGFESVDDAGSIQFSDCSVVVTDTAHAFGWDAGLWTNYVHPWACAGGDFSM